MRILLITCVSLASVGCGRTQPELAMLEIPGSTSGPEVPEVPADTGCEADSGVSTLFSGPGNPDALAVHAGLVYFADWTFGGSVSVVARDGSGLRVLATEQPGVKDLAVDDAGVAWTTTGLTTPGGTLVTVDRAGQTRTLVTNLNQPSGVALGAESVCVAEGSTWGGGGAPNIGRVLRVDRSTGLVTLLAKSAQVTDVACDEAHVYFSDPWLSLIARVPVRGGDVEILSRDFKASRLILSAGRLFFSTGLQVYAMPAPGGTATLLAEVTLRIQGLATDGETTFFSARDTTARSDALFRVREPGSLALLAADQVSARGVALDATHLYWVGGEVAPAYVRSLCRTEAP